MKIEEYVMPAPISSQFKLNEQIVTVTHNDKGTVRVVIGGFNIGEINVPMRITSDATMNKEDYQKYIYPTIITKARKVK